MLLGIYLINFFMVQRLFVTWVFFYSGDRSIELVGMDDVAWIGPQSWRGW